MARKAVLIFLLGLTATLTLCLLSVTAVVVAQGPTLRDMVLEAHDDVSVSISGSSPTRMPFNQLLASAEHVVRATIGHGVSHLSEDGHAISTTYELRNQDVLFSKGGARAFGATATPLTLTRCGGTVLIDGFKVTVSCNDVKVSEGMDVILLLYEWNGAHIAVGDDGIFQVTDSKVVPLDGGPGEHREFAGRDADTFARQISTQRQQIQQR